MTDFIQTRNHDGVLVVRFNRAEKKNAINTQMWIDLRETFRSAALGPTAPQTWPRKWPP